MTVKQRLTQRLAGLLPLPLAAAPERVGINFVCLLAGCAVVLSREPSRLWPESVANAWGVTMIVGGAAAIVGYWRSSTAPRAWSISLERVGYLAILIAALPYGIRMIWVFGWPGLPIGLIFIGIGGMKAIRLLMSTAARDEVLRARQELDR